MLWIVGLVLSGLFGPHGSQQVWLRAWPRFLVQTLAQPCSPSRLPAPGALCGRFSWQVGVSADTPFQATHSGFGGLSR